MTEDYVSFETAKLLKEKGLDSECDYLYANGNIVRARGGKCNWNKGETLFTDYKNECSAPTLQMAMKWLREKHNKIIIPRIRVTDPITGVIDCYCIDIHYIPKNNGGALCFISPTPENGYSTYEEACESGIKYCLENLI